MIRLPACTSIKFSRKLELEIDYFENALTYETMNCLTITVLVAAVLSSSAPVLLCSKLYIQLSKTQFRNKMSIAYVSSTHFVFELSLGKSNIEF